MVMRMKITTLLGVMAGLIYSGYAYGQQNVYSRENSTDLWWNESTHPWYYGVWQTTERRPDIWPEGTPNMIFIGHNSSPVMRVNGTLFAIGSLTFQNSATTNRTFNAIDNGGIGLTIGLYNDSQGHHTFNVPFRLDAAAVQFAANTGQLSLSGSTISLQSHTAQFTGANTINVSSAITGSGAISKSGAGTLNLSGANTFTGSTTASGGTLSVSGTMSSTSYIINGGTLRLSAANILPDAAAIALSSGTFSVDNDETIGNLTISGGTVALAAGRVLTINGTLTLSDQAQLSLGAGAAIRFSSTGALVYNLGAVAVTTSAEWPESHAPSSVTINGGTITLNGNRPIMGSLTLNGGTLDLGNYSADRLVSGGTLTIVNGATLKIGGANTLPANFAAHIIGSTSVIEYNGSSQTIASLNSGQQYGNLVLSGSGEKIMEANIAVANDMTVAAGIDFTIPSGLNLTVGNALNNSGSFTIDNNANLIQVNDVSNTGLVTVIRESAPMWRLDYGLWSSPVAGETLIGFSPQTLPNRFYQYNPLTDAYNAAVTAGGTVAFDEGESYLIRVSNTHPSYEDNPGTPAPWVGSYVGVPNNGDVNVAVTARNAGEGISGFNAVGNPYPSAIKVSEFFARNEGNLVADSPLFFWRKKNGAGTSSYVSLTMSGLIVQSDNTWGDTSDEEFDDVMDNQNWAINPGQGFIVQAATGTIVFDNEMRVAKNHNYHFRNAQDGEATASRLWINLMNEAGDFSQSMVAYTPNTTYGIDYAWDGRAMADGPITLYSLVGEAKLGIQARAPFDAADVVPLGYKAETAGAYTIALDHFDGVFAQGQDIYLRDNLLGAIHDLKEGAYSFSTEAGTLAGRFDVVYAQALNTDTVLAESNAVMVFGDGKGLNILANADMDAVVVYDLTGRLLYSQKGINQRELTIAALRPQQQALIVKVATPKGNVSKKVIY